MDSQKLTWDGRRTKSRRDTLPAKLVFEKGTRPISVAFRNQMASPKVTNSVNVMESA